MFKADTKSSINIVHCIIPAEPLNSVYPLKAVRSHVQNRHFNKLGEGDKALSEAEVIEYTSSQNSGPKLHMLQSPSV